MHVQISLKIAFTNSKCGLHELQLILDLQLRSEILVNDSLNQTKRLTKSFFFFQISILEAKALQTVQK